MLPELDVEVHSHACPHSSCLEFCGRGFFSHACELDAGSAFDGGRCEHRIVSQDRMEK